MSCQTEIAYKPMWGNHKDMGQFTKENAPYKNGMYYAGEYLGYNYPEQLRKEIIEKYPGICFVGYISTDNGTTGRYYYQIIFGAQLINEDTPDGIVQIGRSRMYHDNVYIAFDEEMPWCMRGYKAEDDNSWADFVEGWEDHEE